MYADESDTSGVPRLMLHPSEKNRLSWDVFCMTLLFYSVINVPLQVAFEDMNPTCSASFTGQIWSFYVDLMVDLAFICDMIVNLRTAYWHPAKKQTLVTDQKSIFLNYAKGFLIIDFVGAFPVDLIMLHACADDANNGQNNLLRAPKIIKQLRLLRALRLLRVSRFKRMIDRVRDQLRISPGYLRVLQLLFFIFIVLHYDACFFYWVGVNYIPGKGQTTEGQDTWVMKNANFVDQLTGQSVPVIDLDKGQAYLISWYWACTTIMTVGFGDVTPMTTYEGNSPVLSVFPCEVLAGWFLFLSLCSPSCISLSSPSLCLLSPGSFLIRISSAHPTPNGGCPRRFFTDIVVSPTYTRHNFLHMF